MEYFISFINDVATDFFYEREYVNGNILFSSGGCYDFYRIIKNYFPEIELYIRYTYDHCVFLYQDKLYDSNGIVSDVENYHKATELDLNYILDTFGLHLIHLRIYDTIMKELNSIDMNKVLKYTK